MSTILHSLKPNTAFQNLEVRLDTPTLYTPLYSRNFRNENLQVRGRVIFMTGCEHLVKEINVSFEGRRQVLWYTDVMKPQRIKGKDVLIRKHIRVCPSTTPPDDRRSYHVGPGNHVWTFLFELDALPVESIEGLGGTYVTYHVKATVVMAGYFTKNLSAAMPVRIVRLQDDVETGYLDLDQTESGVWKDELHYHVTAPPRWHHWGRPIVIKFTLQPFIQGISIERIVARLHEETRLKALTKHRILFHCNRLIVSQVEASSVNNSAMLLDDVENLSDGHQFEVEVPFPQSLKACRQSVVQDVIQITHHLKVELYIRNRFAEIDCVSIQFPYRFTFPRGIVFDSKDVAGLPSSIQWAAQGVQEALFATPPAFGQHYSDPIYRPGLMAQTVEGHRGHQVHTYRDESDCYRPLHTTQNSRFMLSLEPPKLPDQADLTKLVRLDQVPSYNTALCTPEVYTDVTDQRPAYIVR